MPAIVHRSKIATESATDHGLALDGQSRHPSGAAKGGSGLAAPKKVKGTSSRHVPSKATQRSLAQLLLLPLSIVAFLVLHIGFAVAKLVHRTWRSFPSRQSQLGHPLLPDPSCLRALGDARRGRRCDDKVAGVSLPTHIAIAFAPPAPSTRYLLAVFLGQALHTGLQSALRLLSGQELDDQGASDCAPSKRLARSKSSSPERLETLRRIVFYCALIGCKDVSVWDDDGTLTQLVEQRTIPASKRPASQWWSLGSSGGSDSEPVDVWAELPLPITHATSQQDLAFRTELREDEAIVIRLHLLSGASHGRQAFASLPRLLAGDDVTTSMVSSMTAHKVDGHLRRLGLTSAGGEPDLLIVWGSHWTMDSSIAEYSRWDLRLTEIAHAPRRRRWVHNSNQGSSPEPCHDIESFVEALRQFAKVEQRFGK